MSDEKATEYIELAQKNGWQLLTHVNGDAAIDQLIKGIEASEKKYGKPDRGFVAIHAQTARKDQVESFKRLGIFPSFFPMHTFYWGLAYGFSAWWSKSTKHISHRLGS